MDPRLTEPEEPRLIDAVGLPAGIDARLAAQIGFLVEVDRLKAVLRASPLAAVDRFENSAEHSWHLAVAVLVLAEHASEPVDTGRTLELVVVHDLVEVYAGDTPLGDEAAMADQEEREQAAADRLFAQLPPDQEAYVRARWDEFEARRSPEARFAKAVDRFVPLLHNWMARGGTWPEYATTADDVVRRTSAIDDAAPALAAARDALLTEARVRGWTAD